MYRPSRYGEPAVATEPAGDPLLLFAIVAFRDISFLDVVRSIVCGALMESIASLVIFSFAAGGGAAALSTSVLTIANLIGGLFILVNNLRELKHEKSVEAETQTTTEEECEYQQLRGTPKFYLQATVAVISFLVFGSVAPITSYGFSSRNSDGRYYKFGVVAAASLACILLLALGKAHTKKPPRSYIETVLYYLTVGFVSSVISFFISEGVNKLLAQSL